MYGGVNIVFKKKPLTPFKLYMYYKVGWPTIFKQIVANFNFPLISIFMLWLAYQCWGIFYAITSQAVSFFL